MNPLLDRIIARMVANARMAAKANRHATAARNTAASKLAASADRARRSVAVPKSGKGASFAHLRPAGPAPDDQRDGSAFVGGIEGAKAKASSSTGDVSGLAARIAIAKAKVSSDRKPSGFAERVAAAKRKAGP